MKYSPDSANDVSEVEPLLTSDSVPVVPFCRQYRSERPYT